MFCDKAIRDRPHGWVAQMPSSGKQWEETLVAVRRPQAAGLIEACSQHLLSTAPISSGQVLLMVAGDSGIARLCVVGLRLKPQNITLWALSFGAQRPAQSSISQSKSFSETDTKPALVIISPNSVSAQCQS